MISLITNATFLVFCFAFLLVLLFRCRMSQWNLSSEEALERTLCILTSRPALIIVICGAFINIGFRIYNGYINPGDLMLDVVVAQQYRQGRPMYSGNTGALIEAELAKHQPSLTLDAVRDSAANRPLGRLKPVLPWLRLLSRPEWTLQKSSIVWFYGHPPIDAILLSIPLRFLDFR